MELQKHKLDLIVARNIRISLEKPICKDTASIKRRRAKYNTCDKNLPTELANSFNRSQARRHNIECK